MTILRENVQELLDQGVIKPSTSAYDSPAFFVPKPGGKGYEPAVKKPKNWSIIW